MDKTRTETFSDGVFAIAATLLVLGFHYPTTDGHLGRFILNLWPSLFAYFVSFLLVGLIWANHHSMFVHFQRVDRTLLLLNTLLLASVAFLPFPTELVAHALDAGQDLKPAALLYGLTLTVGGIFFNAVWNYAANYKKLLKADLSKKFIRQTTRRFLLGPLFYGMATIISLIAPLISLVGYMVLIIFYWLPPKDENKALSV